MIPSSPWRFGPASQQELLGVEPQLVVCTKNALARSPVDFSVHDGLRTLEEQKAYVAAGVSWTLASKHLKQPDGFGHAVDLVPWVGGKLRWEWPLIYPIALSMHAASIELKLELVWGGVWDRQLDELDPANLEGEVEAYVARRRKAGKRASIDGPHFELFW